MSRRIARAVVERRRQRQPIRTARDLAQVVRSVVPKNYGGASRIDPATRTFQALRIAVNGELESLEIALKCAPDALRAGGRLAVISFHSLEDRCAKQAFRNDPRYEPLKRKTGDTSRLPGPYPPPDSGRHFDRSHPRDTRTGRQTAGACCCQKRSRQPSPLPIVPLARSAASSGGPHAPARYLASSGPVHPAGRPPRS